MESISELLDQLEELRAELDLSKEKMARKLDVSLVTYTSWTTGRSRPDGENVIKLLNFLKEKGGQDDQSETS